MIAIKRRFSIRARARERLSGMERRERLRPGLDRRRRLGPTRSYEFNGAATPAQITGIRLGKPKARERGEDRELALMLSARDFLGLKCGLDANGAAD